MANPQRWRFWHLAAVVAAAATLIYVQTWWFDFTHLDDNDLILKQQASLRQVASLYSVFGRTYFGAASTSYYRPIVNLSLVLDAQWSGAHAFGYHVTNVLLHAAASALTLALMLRLGLRKPAAVWATLLFALHPVHAGSVAWIPGRNDVLMTCFALGACLCLLQDADRPGWRRKTLHLSCWLLALLCKETALCLPLLFVALLWATGMPREPLGQRWLWLGYGGVLALYVAARSTVVAASHAGTVTQFGIALLRLPVLVSDLGKLLLPVRLQVLAAPRDAHLWPGLMALAAIALLLWRLPALRNRAVGFALSCTILPMLVSLLGAERVVLENRLYLSTVGIGILLGHALQAVQDQPRRWGRGLQAVAVGVLLVLGSTTLRYSRSFQDRGRFAQAAITASPSSGLAVNLLRRCSLAAARNATHGPSSTSAFTPGRRDPDPR